MATKAFPKVFPFIILLSAVAYLGVPKPDNLPPAALVPLALLVLASIFYFNSNRDKPKAEVRRKAVMLSVAVPATLLISFYYYFSA